MSVIPSAIDNHVTGSIEGLEDEGLGGGFLHRRAGEKDTDSVFDGLTR